VYKVRVERLKERHHSEDRSIDKRQLTQDSEPVAGSCECGDGTMGFWRHGVK
jgi:hypothetical protein